MFGKDLSQVKYADWGICYLLTTIFFVYVRKNMQITYFIYYVHTQILRKNEMMFRTYVSRKRCGIKAQVVLYLCTNVTRSACKSLKPTAHKQKEYLKTKLREYSFF